MFLRPKHDHLLVRVARAVHDTTAVCCAGRTEGERTRDVVEEQEAGGLSCDWPDTKVAYGLAVRARVRSAVRLLDGFE